MNKYINPAYALRNDKLVYIDDVESGLSCNCICPACHGKLIARKGNKNSHHFAHYSADCGKGYETALHMLAKEILSETDEIILPSLSVSTDSYSPNIELYPESKIKIDYVELEKKTDDIIPDIILHSGGRQLIIEICVTHKVEDVKLAKIKNLGISALEINLSKCDRFISKSELENILVSSNENKSWLYNTISEKYIKALYDFSEEKTVIQRRLSSYVDFCPVGARE